MAIDSTVVERRGDRTLCLVKVTYPGNMPGRRHEDDPGEHWEVACQRCGDILGHELRRVDVEPAFDDMCGCESEES